MKVLHVIGGDLSRGAARGAFWLHQGLSEIGVDSKVLVQLADKKEKNIISLSNKTTTLKQKLLSALDKIPLWFYKEINSVKFSTGFLGNNITKIGAYKESDIIHLHWINGGMLSIFQIGKMRKPVIWTIRDMWPMTGGCHYAMDCKKYETGCGYCERLSSRFKYDLSYQILKTKVNSFSKDIRIVGISHWLSECAKKSYLFENYEVSTIENNINTNDFFPIEKRIAKRILGLSDKKKIVLAGAQDLGDINKGFDKYFEALQQLKEKDRLFLLFFGKSVDDRFKNLNFEYRNLGFLHDTVSLRLAYSAADVFVAPSIMDGFGKTLAESMACGTPVVCFDATGPKDIVDHQQNGYKAAPYAAQDLATGIDWVLSDEDRHKGLCLEATDKAVEKFDFKKVSEKYLELYEGFIAA